MPVINALKAKGLEVKFDGADNQKPGWKFHQYELQGVPVRLAMGARDMANNTVEVFRRDTMEKQTVSLGAAFLRVRCLATPLMFMSFFTVHVFQGFGKGNVALFLGVMRWLAFNIPMLFLLNALFHEYGILSIQAVADLLSIILAVVVLRKALKRVRAAEMRAAAVRDI